MGFAQQLGGLQHCCHGTLASGVWQGVARLSAMSILTVCSVYRKVRRTRYIRVLYLLFILLAGIPGAKE